MSHLGYWRILGNSNQKQDIIVLSIFVTREKEKEYKLEKEVI